MGKKTEIEADKLAGNKIIFKQGDTQYTDPPTLHIMFSHVPD